jgi:hypothetical protein
VVKQISVFCKFSTNEKEHRKEDFVFSLSFLLSERKKEEKMEEKQAEMSLVLQAANSPYLTSVL